MPLGDVLHVPITNGEEILGLLLLRASASASRAPGFCSVRGIVRIGIAKPTIARQHIRPTLFF